MTGPTGSEVDKPHVVEKPASIVLTPPDLDIKQADTIIADDSKATEATQLSSAAMDTAVTGATDSEGVVPQVYDGSTAKAETLTVDTEGIVHQDSGVVSAKVGNVVTDSGEAPLDTSDEATAITEAAKPKVEQPVAPEAATINESDDEDDASDFEGLLVEDISGTVTHSDMLTGTPGSRLRNRQALSYFAAVEARIKELEDYVAASRKKDTVHSSLTNAEDLDTKLDESKPDANPVLPADKSSSEQPSKVDVKPERWYLGPGWKTFSEFFANADQAVRPEPIIDVMIEPMKDYLGPPKKRQQRKHQEMSDAPSASQHPEAPQKRDIHRIRINSPLICEEFAKIMDKSRAPQAGQVHLRPFKAFLICREELRKHCADLEVETQALEEQTKGTVALTTEDDAERADSVYEDDDESAVDTVKHLRAFLTFVDEFLKPDIEAFQSLRSRTGKEEMPKFAFDDMWKLFAPGDVLYTPGSRQACMVHSVRGGRRQLRYRDKIDSTADKGETQMIKFTITAFHLDFDGSMFGPVQQEITIEPYEGTRSVMKLPAYPIEYGTIETEDIKPSPNVDANTLKNVVTQRGQHFVRLAKPDEAAHKDYDGPSADATQEQIDGEVIIDFEWYYQIQKDRKPSLGILDAEDEVSLLDLTETYRRRCQCGARCVEQEEERTNLYPDYHIDDLVMTKAHDAMREVIQWRSVSNQDALKTKYALLFPNKVYGFVLKTREWHGLDIDRIKNIDLSEQTFDDLILQDGHKEIVMSLVEMHSGGTKGTEGSSAPKESQKQQRADLVRGKGKGLIILLHGVPGVGKTSTAECVAESTNRPLYSLTCGDIGETPTKVQESLQKAFTLAYRWGCVLLLDEADVFLQQRSGSDMNRNAVVSVFLRTLEYYSGILFLTTNKVGIFDDAFKSRIHVSLYYNQLNLEQSLQIWQVNLARIKKLTPGLHCDEKELLDWVKETWDDKERIPWNGRQIHNAVRTAAALATFNKEDRMIMQLKHFKKVEKASQDFDKYLLETRGHDELELAAKSQQRMDPRKADLYSPEAVASRKPRGQQTHNGFVNRAQGVGLHNGGQQWLGSPQQSPFMTDPSRLPGNGKTYQAGTQQYIGHEQFSDSQYPGAPHLPTPPYVQASSLQQRQTDGLTGLPGQQQPAMYLNEHAVNAPNNMPSQTPQQPPLPSNGQLQQPAQQFLRQQYPNDESAWQATQQIPNYQAEPPKTNMRHVYEDGGPATPSPRGHG